VSKQAAALEMVEQAAGRGDEHVDAAGELGVLVAEGDAADEQGDAQLVVDAVLDEVLLDLGGELAGRLEDEGARHAGAGAALFQHGDHRQGEGGGLAGAGLGDAEDVAAGQDVGDGLGLDGGRFGVAGRSHGSLNLGAEAEFGKRHVERVSLWSGGVLRRCLEAFGANGFRAGGP
jgi:hypothetical protein